MAGSFRAVPRSTLKPSVRLAFCAALLLAVSPLRAAQNAKPPVFSSQVSLVLLPVFVADSSGQAVRGLRPEDFTLYEDGKPVEVVSFRYVDTTSAEDLEQIREASAARRRFLLLFDKSFTEAGGLRRARAAAIEFVRTKLTPSDLAAVATFDANRGIRMVANFTEDRGLLAHAIATLGVPSISRITDPLGLAADLMATDVPLAGMRADSDTPGQLLAESMLVPIMRRMRAADLQSYHANVTMLVNSFRDLATALRRVEGRKQVLYFSSGFDARVLVGERGGLEQRENAQAIAEGRLWDVDPQAQYGSTRIRDLLDEATRNLSAADAVVHSIDVAGLGFDHSLTELEVRPTHETDAGGRESLGYLAAQTGGRFFKDANDLGPVLQEMLDMTSRYYVLGFQPAAEKGPGAFHKVKVKVARKSVRLSHRAGYHERVPAAERGPLQRQFEAAQLVVTGAGSNDLPFSVLCLPFPSPGERQTLGLIMQVPKSSLPRADRTPIELEIYVYAVAEDGTVHDHLAQLARIDPGQADPQGRARGVSVFGTLSVPTGKYTLRLMAQDPQRGTAGVQFMDITVPRYDAQAGFLLPPVVMDEADAWLAMEMTRSGGARPEWPFVIEGTPFVPRTSFEVRSGTTEKLALFAYEPDRPADPAAGLEIQSSLTGPDGVSLPAGPIRILKLSRAPDGRRTYLLGYTPESVPPGDYTLRIGIGEAGTRLESYSLLRVRAAEAAEGDGDRAPAR